MISAKAAAVSAPRVEEVVTSPSLGWPRTASAITEGSPMADEVVEDFRPSSGRITGAIGVLVCVGIVVLGMVESRRGFPPVVVWAALFGIVLFWSASLRPRVRVTESELWMRNMLTTISVPLAAIEQIVVRQVLSVRAGERRYVSSAVGRSWRQALRSNRRR